MNASPPYDMIPVEDGRRLHVICEGPVGAPFVLYDAGAFGIYTDGWWIKEALKSTHRVCLYDRAGMGWSDPLPDNVKATPDWHIEDMRRLRAALGEDRPFVLIGHSMAGLRLHAYANLYAEELDGLVFIDAANPNVLSQSRITQFLSWVEPIMNIGIGLVRTGIMGGLSYLAPDELDLPKQQKSDKRRSISALSHHRATKAEIQAMLELSRETDWLLGETANTLPVSVFANALGGGRNGPVAAAAREHSGFGRVTSLPDETHVSLLNRKNSEKIAGHVRAISAHKKTPHAQD